MALGIAKPRPKYTPPKVCKKSAVVLMPTWNFFQCPNVDHLTMKIMWPAEVFGPITSDTVKIYRALRDPTNLCKWIIKDGKVGPQDVVGFVEFSPAGPTLDVQYEYFGPPSQVWLYEANFQDYDSRKPKLLLPSNIDPDTTSNARFISTCQITI